jgi:hypothetical protein
MFPLSEADKEIREGVVAIVGECSCSAKYRSRWTGHGTDKRDPRCAWHLYGENIASLLRDKRKLQLRLRQMQQRLHAVVAGNASNVTAATR